MSLWNLLRRRRRPEVHLYSILWNEAAMLEFFFRHYDPWVTRYVFFDDGSDDGTREIIAAHPRAELRRFERVVPDSFVMSSQIVHNEAWKESRGQADWVVITAVDEHLHHPDLRGYLDACGKAGVTLVPALGYQMVSKAFPPSGTHLATTLRSGAPWHVMNKLSLFRPDAIEETGFALGRHNAAPIGDLVLPERDELLLLHYKYLGEAYVKQRHAFLAKGLGARDRANEWGVQYLWDDKSQDEAFARFAAAAIDTGAPDFRPWEAPPEPRWWRPAPVEPGGGGGGE